MAVKTIAQSGLSSDPATWGGSLPVDGDSWVIAEGRTLTFNQDLSAWTIGVDGILIEGSEAGTPARLTVAELPGAYFLPLKTGKSVVGDDRNYSGQFYIGTRQTPYPYACQFTLQALAGTTSLINHSYLDTQIFCDNPINRYVILTAQASAGTYVLAVDRDLTQDKFWRAGDSIVIANRYTATFNSQRATITAVTPTTITIDAPLNANYVAGAHVVTTARNVRLLHNVASSLPYTVQGGGYNNTSFGKAIHAEFRNLANAGNGPRSDGTGLEIGGVISGFLYNGYLYAAILNSAVLACGASMQGYGNTLNDCVVIGSSTQNGVMPNETVANDSYFACNQTVTAVNSQYNRCRFVNNQQIGWGGGEIRLFDCESEGNLRDFERLPPVIARRCLLRSAFATYWWYRRDPLSRQFHYDVRAADGTVLWGQVRGQTGGGQTVSTPEVPANPPVPLDFVHVSYFYDGFTNYTGMPMLIDAPGWFDFPVGREPGEPFTITIYCKCSIHPSVMVEPVKFAVIDDNAGWDHPDEVIAAVQPADTADWQTLVLSGIVGPYQKPVLRIRGKHHADSTAWMQVHWNYVLDALPTDEEIAAAVWQYERRTLTP